MLRHWIRPIGLLFFSASLMPAASSVFQTIDSTTKGNWKGVYGQDGFSIAGDLTSIPAYAIVKTTGATPYTWWPSSTDPRALQKGGSATDRIASAFYANTTFTFDVDFTDGQVHQLALYCLDLDTNARSQTISILDAGSNTVLDTRLISGFHDGVYAVWNIQGHVLVRVTLNAGLNPVVSGIFFKTPGGGTPTPTVSLTSPIAGATVSATATVSAVASATTPATLASVQFQLDGSNLGTAASGASPYSISWNTLAATNGSHTLRAIATDSLGQSTTSSDLAVTVFNSGGTAAPGATFVKSDTVTVGNWKGVFGQDGYIIPNTPSDSKLIPAYATVVATGATSYVWTPSSSDPRALLKPASTTDRIASAFYTNSSFSFDVNLTDGQAHQLALYCLDLETNARVETITIRDAGTNAILDQRAVSGFQGGVYKVWMVQGHVIVQVTYSAGLNAVLSGLFFGGATASGAPPTVSITSPGQGNTVQSSISVVAAAAATGATLTSVKFVVDGTTLATVPGAGPTFSTTWNTTTAADGNHSLTAVAVDSLNRQTTSALIQVTVANGTPPTVSVTGPGAGSTVQDTITIAAMAGASGATLTSVQFLVDGVNLGAPVPGAGPSFSTSWNSTSASNGSHTITAIATDSLNRHSTSAGIAVTVNNSGPPTVSISSPAAGAALQNSVSVTATATSSGSTISSVQIKLDGSNLGAAVTGAGPTYSTSWNTTAASNGSHTLTAIATDALNRQTTSAGVTITVNNVTTPAVSITSPAAGGTVQNSVTVSANATTTGATMSSVQFQLDGNNLGSTVPGAGPTYSTSWNTISASNGSHTLTAIATDSLNRQATSAGVTITVNNVTPPAVSITSPVAGGTVQNSVILSANATATGATMSSVQFQLDGNNLGSPVPGAGPLFSSTWDSTATPNGLHTLTAIATDSLNRQTTSASIQITVSNSGGAVTPTASFVKLDTTTQGNWKGVYGQDGAMIANDANLPPAYATTIFSGSNPYTWLNTTSDVRALIKGNSTVDRIASAFYSSNTFTIDLNLTDGASHQVVFYCLDWDTSSRNQTVTILDARNNAVLDTRGVTAFHGGLYLVYNLSGHLLIKVANTSSLNGVVSGIFFRTLAGVAPPSVSITSPTGSPTISGPVNITANAASAQGIASVQFQLDGSNLGQPVTTAPFTLQWASPTTTDGTHTLRAIAADPLGLKTTSSPVTVTVSNGPPPTPNIAFAGLDTATSGSWVGTYGQNGFIIANDITKPPFYATVNFNGATTWTWHAADPTTDLPGLQKSPTSSERIGAAFMQPFNGNSSSNPPLLIDVNFVDNQTHQFSMYFVDWHHPIRTQLIEALDPNSLVVLDTRTISAFYNGIYLTWNVTGRIRFRITVISWPDWPSATGAPDSVVVSGLFFNDAPVTPPVPPPTISITAPTTNQSVSGIFTVTANAQSQAAIGSVQFQADGANLGPPQTGPGPTYSYQWNTAGLGNGPHILTAVATDSPYRQRTTAAPVTFLLSNPLPSTSATFVGTDDTTKGSWKGVYGQQGYVIASDSTSLPSYASLTFSGTSQLVWSLTTDPRALLQANSTTSRIASVFYASPGFSLDLYLSDSQSHRLALYFLDWDGSGRSQSVTVLDANTLQVLDTRSVASFQSGRYLVWNITGHVLIQVSKTAVPSAVLSGVFLGQ
ncbi:MAG: Ig-like domain-containing protein [Candidatus Solibacter sp.]